MSDPAFPRWLAMTGVRVVAAFGGMLGVVLLGRARDLPTQGLGVAIVIAALWVMATVPRALARRWRSGGDMALSPPGRGSGEGPPRAGVLGETSAPHPGPLPEGERES